MPLRATVGSATRLRSGGPFGLPSDGNVFLLPILSFAGNLSLLQAVLLSCSPSLSASVQELLHPLALVSLYLPRSQNSSLANFKGVNKL